MGNFFSNQTTTMPSNNHTDVDDDRETSTPVISTPVISTPVISTPVISTPVIPTPIISTPVISTPVISTPVISTPVIPTPVIYNHSDGITFVDNSDSITCVNNHDNNGEDIEETEYKYDYNYENDSNYADDNIYDYENDFIEPNDVENNIVSSDNKNTALPEIIKEESKDGNIIDFRNDFETEFSNTFGKKLVLSYRNNADILYSHIDNIDDIIEILVNNTQDSNAISKKNINKFPETFEKLFSEKFRESYILSYKDPANINYTHLTQINDIMCYLKNNYFIDANR